MGTMKRALSVASQGWAQLAVVGLTIQTVILMEFLIASTNVLMILRRSGWVFADVVSPKMMRMETM
jgi:hypothetical protein